MLGLPKIYFAGFAALREISLNSRKAAKPQSRQSKNAEILSFLMKN
jgi:hypothetical protein